MTNLFSQQNNNLKPKTLIFEAINFHIIFYLSFKNYLSLVKNYKIFYMGTFLWGLAGTQKVLSLFVWKIVKYKN